MPYTLPSLEPLCRSEKGWQYGDDDDEADSRILVRSLTKYTIILPTKTRLTGAETTHLYTTTKVLVISMGLFGLFVTATLLTINGNLTWANRGHYTSKG